MDRHRPLRKSKSVIYSSATKHRPDGECRQPKESHVKIGTKKVMVKLMESLSKGKPEYKRKIEASGLLDTLEESIRDDAMDEKACRPHQTAS